MPYLIAAACLVTFIGGFAVALVKGGALDN